MTSKKSKPNSQVYKNPIELLDNNTVSNRQASIDKRKALFEYPTQTTNPESVAQQEKSEKQQQFTRKEFQLYTKEVYFEEKKRYEIIQTLSEQIRQEIKVLKAKSKEFSQEVDQIEKHTLQSLPEKPGIYHVRYLELLLQFLKGLREKVSDANTWLTALQSKKKKRGSLFVALSKKKGTQYSLSQELSSARTVA